MIIVQVVAVMAISLTLFAALVVAVACGSWAALSYFGRRHDQSVETEEVIRRLADMSGTASPTLT
jgi:uncharacterized membrane protein